MLLACSRVLPKIELAYRWPGITIEQTSGFVCSAAINDLLTPLDSRSHLMDLPTFLESHDTSHISVAELTVVETLAR